MSNSMSKYMSKSCVTICLTICLTLCLTLSLTISLTLCLNLCLTLSLNICLTQCLTQYPELVMFNFVSKSMYRSKSSNFESVGTTSHRRRWVLECEVPEERSDWL